MAPKARDRFPRVVAVDESGSFLLHAAERDGDARAYYLYICDAHTGRATRLPPIPASLGRDRTGRSSSSGLDVIVDAVRGHAVVAQLRQLPRRKPMTTAPPPPSSASTANPASGVRSASRPARRPQQPRNWSGGAGVISHAGNLWWLDNVHGILTCDPFATDPELRFVPLPEGCDVPAAAGDLDGRRLISVSEGKLWFVEMVDLPGDTAVRGWSMEAAAPAARWTLDYVEPLSSIWSAKLKARMLRNRKRLQIALVTPFNHNMLYLSLKSRTYVIDVVAQRMIKCVDVPLGASDRLYAWELQHQHLCPLHAVPEPAEQSLCAPEDEPQPVLLNHVEAPAPDAFVARPDPASNSTGSRRNGKNKSQRELMKRSRGLKSLDFVSVDK